MVPAFFEPYAQDLAARVTVRGRLPLLEVACGTGVLTRRLRAAVVPETAVVATDLNEPMLAEARASSGDLVNVMWHVADAADLPFPGDAFCSVVCQFGFMFVPDRIAAFTEARRVTAAGGQLLFNVWDSLQHNPSTRMAEEIAVAAFPADPPAFYTIPFGYNDTTRIEADLRAAGFTDIACERVPMACVGVSALSVAQGLMMGTPMRFVLADRGLDIEALTRVLAAALSAEGGAEPYRSTMQAVVVTAS